MYLAVARKIVIDRHYQKAREEERNKQDEIVIEACEELEAITHEEVSKVFVEPDEEAMRTNIAAEARIDYYDITFDDDLKPVLSPVEV